MDKNCQNKGRNVEKLRIYQDAHGEWRWWALDGQGNIIKASETGFTSRQACKSNAAASGHSQAP